MKAGFIGTEGSSTGCKHELRLHLLLCLGLSMLLLFISLSLYGQEEAARESHACMNPFASTADHSAFKELSGPFEIDEISSICVQCHNEASQQLLGTTHWLWEVPHAESGRVLGKKHIANNFLMSMQANIEGCTTCHISFDWTDKSFDFESGKRVDCLICHDTTGTYALAKFHQDGAKCTICHDERLAAGNRQAVDLVQVAQNVGQPSRQSCGSCHFYAGSADGAKHGDLDSSLVRPDASLDVHMDADGSNFCCSTCHRTVKHAVEGSRYSMRPSDSGKIDVVAGGRGTCQSCHGDHPMQDPKLNDHTDVVACQTCHIPEFARGGVGTKMMWDWSSAGKRGRRGAAIVRKDEAGHVVYSSQKGDVRWESNVVPTYLWFNGQVDYLLTGDRVDPSELIYINQFLGSAGDSDSRIYPVKVALSKQFYDPVNQTLALPRLVGRGRDPYWSGYVWKRALTAGMKRVGLPFSGEFEFVDTAMLWPINHMVAPVEDSLACADCHAKGGRMAGVDGVYIPGRDRLHSLDIAGWTMIVLAMIGVMVHGSVRILLRRKAS